jgi:RHS repeat-associated protein
MTVAKNSDYYPFGMVARSVVSNNTYRYGFNGQEHEDNLTGGDYDFGARIYDPRTGRWLAIDPLFRKYPGISPYVAFADNPVYFTDPDGQEIYDGKNKVVVTWDGNKPIFKLEDGSDVSAHFKLHGQRLMNAMATTEIGRDAIAIWDKNAAHIRIKISKAPAYGEYGLTSPSPNREETTSEMDIDVTIYEAEINHDKKMFANPKLRIKLEGLEILLIKMRL